MANDTTIRWNWIKGMYIYTIVGAGGVGLAFILMPNVVRSIFSMPKQEPIAFGALGSIYIAFGLLSILGLRSPLKFLPVLLFQLTYKVVWFVGLVIPLLISGNFPPYGIPLIIIFATYIIGDLIAIPFPYVLAKAASD